jgi:hypothetical protein
MTGSSPNWAGRNGPVDHRNLVNPLWKSTEKDPATIGLDLHLNPYILSLSSNSVSPSSPTPEVAPIPRRPVISIKCAKLAYLPRRYNRRTLDSLRSVTPNTLFRDRYVTLSTRRARPLFCARPFSLLSRRSVYF